MTTRDFDVAFDLIRSVYNSADLTLNREEAFLCTLELVGDERFTLANVRIGAGGRSRYAPDTYLIVTTRAPGFAVESRGDQLDVSAPVACPIHEVDSRWADQVDVENVHLDVGAVGELIGRHFQLRPDVVRLTGSAPISRERLATWEAATSMLRGVAAQPEVFEHELVRDSIFRTLAAALFTVFPNNTLDLDVPRDSATALPAHVRRAIAWMESNAHRSITVADIAAAARLSPRGLQSAFERLVGRTPMQELRRIRLDLAHRDLLAADPTQGATVAQIAARWGFGHPGRFSHHYRSAYGVPPSRTLRS